MNDEPNNTHQPHRGDNDDAFDRITRTAMQRALGYDPKPFQLHTISHILKMNPNSPLNSQKPMPTLLVQGTGGGKTSVYQTVGVVKGGVSLIIQNTLSLSSDQLSKVEQIATNIPNTFFLQLDAIKATIQQQKVINQLSTMTTATSNKSTIFLFTSPEALLKKPWRELINTLKENKTLKFICIDEVHLFVNYGITFRPSFISLRETLFQIITSDVNYGSLHVPVLFMTATFNIQMLHLLQKMTGTKIYSNNIIWSDASSFNKRNITITLSQTKQRMRIFKNDIDAKLCHNLKTKAIIYSSMANNAEKIQDEIDSHLDNPNGPIGDTVLINGDMEAEWKFVTAKYFTKKNDNIQQLIDKNDPYPRILVATSGCIGAGLDSDDVDLVLRDGFPSSLQDLIQEMGRCGRGLRAPDIQNPGTDLRNPGTYHLVINPTTFTYLVSRIHEESSLSNEENVLLESVISKEDQKVMQIQNLLAVLRLVYLNIGCWHHELECSSSCVRHSVYIPCQNRCPHCKCSMKEYIMPLVRRGVIEFLVYIFLESGEPTVTVDVMVKALEKFDDVGRKVYGRSTKAAPIRKFLESTVLQMIASEIVLFRHITRDEKNHLILSLHHIGEDRTPAYLRDEYWHSMYLIG